MPTQVACAAVAALLGLVALPVSATPDWDLSLTPNVAGGQVHVGVGVAFYSLLDRGGLYLSSRGNSVELERGQTSNTFGVPLGAREVKVDSRIYE